MIVQPFAFESPQIPQENLEFWMDFTVPNCYVTGSLNAAVLNPNTNIGTLSNNANYQAVSSSMWFPGANPNSIITTNYTQALGNFTAIAIYKCNSTTATGTYQRILDKAFATGFFIGRNNLTANSWGGGVKQAASPYGIYATFPDLQWQMIGLSRTGTSIKLWNKGTVVNSQTGVGTAMDTTALKIARDPSVAYGLNGYCSATLIYSRELTPDEMTQIYQYYAPRFNF
jgi:hypothetical protein